MNPVTPNGRTVAVLAPPDQPPAPPARPDPAASLERVLLAGDLAQLRPDERVFYYRSVCESLGLNPLTRPFAYITLNGKLTLYAQRDCTDQLRSIHKISVRITSREVVDGVYTVTAQASRPDGRCDESLGAVSIEGLKGEARANAMMKCETKAKRRVTLSICGLGVLDETEVETIPGAAPAESSAVEASPDGAPGRAESPVLPAVDTSKLTPAQRQVLERKLRYLTDADPAKKFDRATMLARFEDMRQQLGDELYHVILNRNGKARADQIHLRNEAIRIYRQMEEQLKRMKEGK